MPFRNLDTPIGDFANFPLRNRDQGHGAHWVPCLFPHPDNPAVLSAQPAATPILSFCQGCAPSYLRPPTPANYLAHFPDARSWSRRNHPSEDEEADRAACAIVAYQTAHDGMAWDVQGSHWDAAAEERRVAAMRAAVAAWGDEQNTAATTAAAKKKQKEIMLAPHKKRKSPEKDALAAATTATSEQEGGDRKRRSPEKARRIKDKKAAKTMETTVQAKPVRMVKGRPWNDFFG